ncbi:MAG: hypothetical protein K2W95_05935 [Candidatus Obscuribacterales bacterium]|nr:hypothetical protein [Candidatus Obscuribacterales bacterium]
MKLSAVFLLSVNVVAASQVAAVASECSDTASFLQESLGSTPHAAPIAQASPRPARISHSIAAKPLPSQRRLVPMTPIADKGTKLRAFMPGRYLPSEGDLQPRAYASEPQLSAPLTGQVSAAQTAYSKVPTTYSGDYVDQLALAAAHKVKAAAKRFAAAPKTMPGSQPVLPGQYGGAAQRAAVPALANLIGADQSLTAMNQLPSLNQAVVPVPSTAQASPVVVPQPQQTAAFPTVPPPNLSKYEEAKFARMVEASLPERLYANGSNGDMRASSRVNPGLAGAGPPPFPLSLAGGQMSAAAGHGMRPGPAMEAKFGNWHENNNLPQAAFHTYLSQAKMAGPLAVARMQGKGSKRTGRQAYFCQPSAPSTHVAKAPVQHKVAKKSVVKSAVVACYPQYHRYPGAGG